MKNRLLAVMALCGATSSTLPLWAAWDGPELQFVEPNLATDGTGGEVLWQTPIVAGAGKYASRELPIDGQHDWLPTE